MIGRVEPPAHRMGAAISDALARALVFRALASVPPPWAADGKLHPALAVLTDLGRSLSDIPSIGVLADLCRLPERTFMRRFRTSTGTTPIRFARWFRLAALRSERVGFGAGDAGYTSERALRRALGRDTVPSSARTDNGKVLDEWQ
jgi:transcriptional regulator GlxA family with amidase domain